MRGLAAVVLCACVVLAAAARTEAATCTAAQKRKNVAALKKFQRGMAVQRRAYFRRHKSRKARAAFVRRQQARLRALRKAAACRVPILPTPPPPQQPPPPAPPPPSPSPPAVTDLVLGLSATPARFVHEPVTYTLVVENRGNANATAVSVAATLPPGLQRVSAPGCSGIRVLECPVGTLGAGGSATRTFLLRPMQTGPIALTVAASSNAQDASPADNAAAVSISPAPLPTYAMPPSTGFAFHLARPAWADERTPSGFPHVGEWPKTPGVFRPGVGALRGGLLFVDFPDHPGSGSALTPEEATALIGSASIPWYREASYGRLDLSFQRIPGWHRMSKPAADYGLGQCCDLVKARALVQEAVDTADAAGADFSGFDALWVIVPTTAERDVTIQIDIRWPGDGISVDGNELRHWITGPASYPIVPTEIEPARFSDWVATHEIGHFLGLPDLYLKPPGCPACPNTFEPVGYWDLMSEVPLHAHFLAWHKWLLGWLDPAQLRLVQSGDPALDVELAPLAAPGGIKAVVVPLSPSVAYVVEAREPLGWEAGLCDRGVLVYSVDSTKRNAEGPVGLQPAHSSAASPACGPTWDAAYDVGPGEDSSFNDAAAGVSVEVLERMPDGRYRVRVTH